jgi:hypothetical protein
MSSTTEVAKANELDRGDNNMTTTSKEDDVYEKENIGTRSSVSGKSLTEDVSNDTSSDLRRNIPTVKISPDLVVAGINDSKGRSPVDRAMLKIAAGTASPSSLKENNKRREQHGITGPLSPVHLNLVNLANNGRKKKKNLAAWSNKTPVRQSKQEREEQQKLLVGTIYQHMLLRSSNPSDEEDNNKDIDDDVDIDVDVDENKTDKKDTLYINTSQNLGDDEVGTTTDTTTNIDADVRAEEEEKNQDTNNILNHSKQLVGFLGGTFRAALNQNRLSKAPPPKSSTAEKSSSEEDAIVVEVVELEQNINELEEQRVEDGMYDLASDIDSIEESGSSVEQKGSIVQRAMGGFALKSLFSSSQHSERCKEEISTTEDSNQVAGSNMSTIKDTSTTPMEPRTMEGHDVDINGSKLSLKVKVEMSRKEERVKKFKEMIQADSIDKEEGQTETGLNDVQSQTLKYVDDDDDNDKQPTSQAQKYWETLLAPTEQLKVDNSAKVVEKEFQTSVQEEEEEEVSKPTTTTPERQERKTNMSEDVIEVDVSSPQSTVSIPEDYSPRDRNSERDESSKGRTLADNKENSPGSLLYNMTSNATANETPVIDRSFRGIEYNAIIDSSPAGSDFHNMLSSATAAQTPLLGMATPNHIGCIVGYSPAVSNFNSMLEAATAGETPNVDTEAKTISNSPDDTAYMIAEKYISKEASSLSFINTPSEILGDTPVKSNRTDAGSSETFRSPAPSQQDSAKSTSSLLSNCDESEDGSIYTTLSHQSSIQSNTPRSRRVMEWLGPNPSNTELWPVPSMATKVKSSETPERQLPAYNHSSNPMWGRQQQRVLSHQIKSKSTQLSDWWVPQLNHLGCNTSPTSLPSMLGSASVNEVSDLESPNIYTASALNFKFSDEESTIQSQSIQSIHEASDIHSVPGNETLLRIASPQSLMTVATPTVGYPTDEEYSVEEGYRKVTTNVPRAHLTPSTASISMPTTQGDSVSPHSTITHESFQQAYDDYSFKPPLWLRRCVILGILVAIIGAITVFAVTMTNNGRKDEEIASKPNTEEEWMNVNGIDIMMPTTSPTGVHSFTKTVSPTIASSSVSGGGGGQIYPTNRDNMPDSRTSSFPTSFPTQFVVDTPPPTFSPSNPSFRPTSKPDLAPAMEVTADPISTPTSNLISQSTSMPSRETTGKPTSKPSSVSTLKPTSKPSLSTEQLQQLAWNRIVNGEDVWRPSEEEIVRTPLWYFAADDKTQGIQLEVLDASRDDRFLTQLRTAVDDYSSSKAVSSLQLTKVPHEVLCPSPEIGQIKVCSGDFGNTDWIGSTILFMRNDFIVAALIRVNENPVSSPAGDALFQYALCHQLGHALGLSHNTAGIDSLSCMQDFGENTIIDGNIIRTNDKLEHPNNEDLERLETLYGSANTRRLRGQ